MLESRFDEKNIKVEVNVEEFQIESSKSLLMSVWTNLLDNAVKFTDENGEIVVSLKSCGDKATIIISDNGIGMKEEDLKRVFERFYQADKSHNSEGNGLGLSLVKGIIDKVKGSISVESVYQQGTTFVIELNKKSY